MEKLIQRPGALDRADYTAEFLKARNLFLRNARLMVRCFKAGKSFSYQNVLPVSRTEVVCSQIIVIPLAVPYSF